MISRDFFFYILYIFDNMEIDVVEGAKAFGNL